MYGNFVHDRTSVMVYAFHESRLKIDMVCNFLLIKGLKGTKKIVDVLRR